MCCGCRVAGLQTSARLQQKHLSKARQKAKEDRSRDEDEGDTQWRYINFLQGCSLRHAFVNLALGVQCYSFNLYSDRTLNLIKRFFTTTRATLFMLLTLVVEDKHD